MDPEKTQEVIDRIIYRDVKKMDRVDLKAGLVYNPEKEQDALLIKEELKEQGIEVVCERKNSTSRSLFIANSNDITNKFYNDLTEKIPE